ncbi:MAG TPA: cytochrome c oxidase subunit 3 family protein [Bryobacteraceae bacterium]|nr:cytochrome c oxidase subunit 3 family protein [Bryobacteraceae bacterium]
MSTTSVDLHTHSGGHAAAHADDPHHQHHFTTMEQQFDTSKIGMWLFLATEVLLFGGLFVGFGMMQARYPREFVEAHTHLVRWQGALNTVVLLISSFTMVLAVQAAKKGDKAKQVLFLALTILCACIFLVVKYFEYSHKYEEGWLPGRFYSYKGDSIPACHAAPPGEAAAAAPAANAVPCTNGYATFFSFYFMMTGLHGFHILAGIGVLSWILIRAKRGEFSASYYTPVDLVGLYWHLVDLIWIYLFPLYYLIQ